MSRLVLASAAQARALDAAASQAGVPSAALMALASFQLARLAQRLLAEAGRTSATVAAVAGRGNNGADALGCCRHLAAWGNQVRAAVLGDTSDPASGYSCQARSAAASGVQLRPGAEAVGWALAGADLILDGVLGTGQSGPPRPPLADVIEAINQAAQPVLAIDLPSGMDGSSGARPGACVRATTTLMLGVAKTGCLEPSARPFVGELWLADIGIPAAAYAAVGMAVPAMAEAGLIRVRET
ncbi:MAG: NAD(P)H-hydrate epimerase [Candidatus Dormibacteria bacterium]